MRRLIALLAMTGVAACSSATERSRQTKALISSHCAACHQIPGIDSANGRVGPSLAHIGRQQIIAGYFANTPGLLTLWVEHPQRLLPGNAMPEMQLSHEQAMAIVDYLYTME